MRFVRLLVAAAAWGAALACVPHPSADPVCEGSPVSATQLLTFVTDSGDVMRAPTNANIVNALLPLPGTGRGYTACNGNESNGNITIASVPGGTWVLQVDQTYVFTTQRSVDFGQAFLGRPFDQIKFPTKPTSLSINAGQMDPWVANEHHLELFSSNAGFGVFNADLNPGASGVPTGGETSLALTLDWRRLNAYNPLLDSSLGDTLFVNQHEKVMLTNGTGRALVKQLTSTPTMTDGSTATVTGPFVQVPTMGFSTTWSRASYDSQAAAMAGDTNTVEQDFFVEAIPEGRQRGNFDVSMELFSTGFGTAGDTDATLDPTFGRPPPKYDPIIVTLELFPVTRFTETINGFVRQEEAIGSATIAALCAAVRGPQIDGHDLQGASSSPMVGSTPSVSWTQPMPVPDAVRIFVEKPNGKGGHTTAATLIVPTSIDNGRNHVDIPAGVLSSGEQYYLLIDAIVAVGWQPESAPLQLPMPHCVARFVSQPFGVSF